MLRLNNHIIDGKHHKPILLDIGFKPNNAAKPLIIFAHGFKGFKDWGHFNKVMGYFIGQGFVFLKFNFSHNGGTVEQPIDFPDLEAFGHNNYSKELDDLKTVVDWIEQTDLIPENEIDKSQIYLIGHSRGGGIAILGANQDNRIKKLITWAAVADFETRLPKDVSQWEKDGVIHIENARTKQQMPMYYQFVEDLKANADKLDIQKAEETLSIPHLIVHGSSDEAVDVADAKLLASWNNKAELYVIEGAGHTFGAKHPYTEKEFPTYVIDVLTKTLFFLKK